MTRPRYDASRRCDERVSLVALHDLQQSRTRADGSTGEIPKYLSSADLLCGPSVATASSAMHVPPNLRNKIR